MTTPTTDRRLGLNGGAAIKVPCRAATTANITLSGEQTVDGVACVTGDRVLVKNQTDQTTNGVYDVSTAAWTRSYDYNGNFDVVTGTIVMVISGTTNINTYWRLSTTGTITIGTSNLTYEYALAGDAAMVSFIQSGAGAVATTVQAELRRTVNIEQFGAAGDGVTDDAAAIQAAHDALPAAGGSIVLGSPGKAFYFGATLNFTKRVTVEGHGYREAPNSTGPTVLLKAATLNGTGIKITGGGSALKNFLLNSYPGNGGYGIHVLANSVDLSDIGACNMGSHGIRIGADSTDGTANANSWSMTRVLARDNGGHGIYIADESGGVDVNAGVGINVTAQLNAGDGIRVGLANANTFIGGLTEQNTGYGLNITAGSENVFIGGDYNEINTAGSVNVAATCAGNIFLGADTGTYTDAGTGTIWLGAAPNGTTNKLTLGGTNALLGIGTISPASAIHISKDAPGILANTTAVADRGLLVGLRSGAAKLSISLRATNNDTTFYTATGAAGAETYVESARLLNASGRFQVSQGLCLSNIQSGITAFAGGGQANATQLTGQICRIATVATAADSVKLPAATGSGMQVIVVNRGANSCNVFPATGGAIDALAVNTALAVAAGRTTTFYDVAANAWISFVGA